MYIYVHSCTIMFGDVQSAPIHHCTLVYTHDHYTHVPSCTLTYYLLCHCTYFTVPITRSFRTLIKYSILELWSYIMPHMKLSGIGGGNRGQGGPWPLLNLRPLHRIVIFAIENHFSLIKWPSLLSVTSSASSYKFIK